VRDQLGRFGFAGDRAFDPVGRFSGGEKARLTLALLVARRPNLLLLDEPTNHLDIDMRHALTVALQSFEGGLVVVSHDRHLIKTVADSLWLVADGKLSVFDGDLDDYQQWLRSRARRTPRTAAASPGATRRAAVQAPAGPRPRRRLSELRRELERVEKRIAELAAGRTRVEAALCDDPLHGGLQAEHAALTREAAAMETRWMEVATELEASEAQTAEAQTTEAQTTEAHPRR
jgi:ATP-binding cassette subfamily F protein 3